MAGACRQRVLLRFTPRTDKPLFDLHFSRFAAETIERGF